MASDSDKQLHILFFPLMAHGHTLPLIDVARLFISRGAKTTIITTPANAPHLNKSTQTTQINLKIIKFPSQEAGLPDGLENLDMISDMDTFIKFFSALPLLQEQLEQVLQELCPDALVSDTFFPWTTDAASKYGVPRLVFHGSSFFTMCCLENLEQHQPHKKVSSDTEFFQLPDFPDPIKFTRLQLSDTLRSDEPSFFTELRVSANEAEKKSYGTVFNSFYELEPRYVDYFRNVMRRRAWHIGPVSLCNKNLDEKAQRGKESSINEHDCIKWLDSKKPSSVLYVCFGTIASFTDSQLLELAKGLESSGQDFIWVVRESKNDDEEEKEKWLPNGYKKRIEGKGLIIRGWAPQVLILEHEAVGGFMTHCGWNSTLEGVSAGLPMVTWPIFADQFFNERLICDVLRIGVGVGAQRWVKVVGDFVESAKIEKAIKEVMVGGKAEEIRSRAKKIGELAKNAVKGGSSYNDFSALIQELKSYHS